MKMEKGNRKVYMTLYLVKADVTQWIAEVGKFLMQTLAVFTGGNAVERFSESLNKPKPFEP